MENNFSENDQRNLFDEEFTLPPDLAWDQVEQGIRRPRKKKRRLPFFLIFACGLTVVISVFSFFFLKKIPVAPNTMVAETSEKFLNKNNDSVVVAALEKEGLTEEKKQDNSQKRQSKKTTPFTDISIVNKQEAGTFPTKNEFKNPMPALMSSEENVLAESEKNKLVLTEESEIIRLLPTLSFPFLLKNNEIASIKPETNIKPLLTPKKNLLQLELSGGTVLTNNIYPSENELINAEMQTALSQPIAYSLHGGILFQKHKNIFFEAGFRFTEMKSLFSYTETSTREVVQENAITQVTFNTFTLEEIVTRSSRTDVETLQRTVKKINRLQITELPLTIGYALLKNKWQFSVSGEIGLASIGFSGFVLDENLQLIDYSKATKQNIYEFGYMYGGGVEINRQVAGRTSIGLKCRYTNYGGRGQMTDFSPRTIGVSLGVKFSLSNREVIPY